jgi:hypothetical protein
MLGRRRLDSSADPLTLVLETSMTPTLEDLEQRLTALEERVDQESGLRASQDRDLGSIAATLSAQHSLLQALAISESEHTEKLARLDIEIRQLRSETRGGMQKIVGMLDTLIAREDDR